MDGDVPDLAALRRDRAPARRLADGRRGACARRARRHRPRHLSSMRRRPGRGRHLDGHAVEDAVRLRRLHRRPRGELIDLLRHTAPGFVYSVGLAPPLAAAALESLRILHAEPWRVARLQANAALFLRLARDARLRYRRAPPGSASCRSSSAARSAPRGSPRPLFEAGVNVQPILFPAVPERRRPAALLPLRRAHPAQIDHAAAVIADASRGTGAGGAGRMSGGILARARGARPGRYTCSARNGVTSVTMARTPELPDRGQ